MNLIVGNIAHKAYWGGCALVNVHTDLGIFYVLIIDEETFEKGDEVKLSFKESDVILSDKAHFASIPNRFEGAISKTHSGEFFTRICIKSPLKDTKKHTDIYALVTNPLDISFASHTNIAWYVQCAHILLEKV